MEAEVHYFAGFLYGVNIPGGVWISSNEIHAKLNSFHPKVRFIEYVGDTDNLIFEAPFDRGVEDLLREALYQHLSVDSVVYSSANLDKILTESKAYLRSNGYTLVTPYRVIRENHEWEIGLVLSSQNLPSSMHGKGGLFKSGKNAVALKVIKAAGLLVEKRRKTEAGKRSRITWGSTVINPWKRILMQSGAWKQDQCLTSRALGSVERVVARLNALAE